MPISLDSLSVDVLAIGSLGTAASALVDSAKAWPGGGPSNHGFPFISSLIDRFLGGAAKPKGDALRTSLHAGWINGVDLNQQKANAKAQIKAQLSAATAPAYAQTTGVNAGILAEIAALMNGEATGEAPAAPLTLTPPQTAVLSHFELALTAQIDEAYQRADQIYRNASKAWAMVAAIVLAEIAIVSQYGPSQCLVALVAGLLATPLAPVAKNASSAIANAAAALKGLNLSGTAQ